MKTYAPCDRISPNSKIVVSFHAVHRAGVTLRAIVTADRYEDVTAQIAESGLLHSGEVFRDPTGPIEAASLPTLAKLVASLLPLVREVVTIKEWEPRKINGQEVRRDGLWFRLVDHPTHWPLTALHVAQYVSPDA
jgi:hypothetical protein